MSYPYLIVPEPKPIEPTKPMSSLTDEELLDILKKDTDFEKLVFPTSWHKKFPDLPKAECADPKEYLKESPWMKRAYVRYDNNGKFVEIAAKPGGNQPILPAPEVPTLTITQSGFSDAITESVTSDQPDSQQ